jgi:hypothetical protein
VKGPITEASAANPGGSDSACEREGAPARMREGTHAREGGAEGKGGSSQSAAAAQGAQARVQARARVTSGPTTQGDGTNRWILVPVMMRVRPLPVAVPLIGTSPEAMSALGGLRRGDMIEVEGELTLASLGDEGAWLGVWVWSARLVSESVPEVAHEG